jgi:hypothetical protein
MKYQLYVLVIVRASDKLLRLYAYLGHLGEQIFTPALACV